MQGNVAEDLKGYEKQKAKLKSLQVRYWYTLPFGNCIVRILGSSLARQMAMSSAGQPARTCAAEPNLAEGVILLCLQAERRACMANSISEVEQVCLPSDTRHLKGFCV